MGFLYYLEIFRGFLRDLSSNRIKRERKAGELLDHRKIKNLPPPFPEILLYFF